MNARITTATRLGFREQARRPLLLVLVVVLPFFFITRAIARRSITRTSDCASAKTRSLMRPNEYMVDLNSQLFSN